MKKGFGIPPRMEDNMNKLSPMSRVFVLMLIAVFSLCGMARSSDVNNFKPVELTLATSFSTTHGIYGYLEKWGAMVKEATDGKVSVEIYPSNTLVAASDMRNAVVNGIVDLVETDISYDPAAFPLLSAVYLPNMGMKSSVTATYAFNEYFKSDFAELKGMKIMFVYGMTPFALLSNKPISKLEDLKGLQIRASGYAIEAMRFLGASAIGMPISEVYEAAQKGTIEAICNSYEVLKGWNFAEVVKYGTIAPVISIGTHYIAMNQDVWDSLPSEYQAAIEKVNNEMLTMIAPSFDEMDEEGYEFGLEKNIQFSEVAPDELERWKTALQPIIDKWIADKTAMGLDAQAAYDSLMRHIKEQIAIHEK